MRVIALRKDLDLLITVIVNYNSDMRGHASEIDSHVDGKPTGIDQLKT